MPNDPRRELGREGERRAAAHLAQRGYRIEKSNVRIGGVEIDLIARRGRTVVFIEVKTRSGDAFGGPLEAVDARKRARMQTAARAWLAQYGHLSTRIRFDVVACRALGHGAPDQRRWQIEHWPAAFDAND